MTLSSAAVRSKDMRVAKRTQGAQAQSQSVVAPGGRVQLGACELQHANCIVSVSHQVNAHGLWFYEAVSDQVQAASAGQCAAPSGRLSKESANELLSVNLNGTVAVLGLRGRHHTDLK